MTTSVVISLKTVTSTAMEGRHCRGSRAPSHDSGAPLTGHLSRGSRAPASYGSVRAGPGRREIRLECRTFRHPRRRIHLDVECRTARAPEECHSARGHEFPG